MMRWWKARLARWLEPELLQPFMLGLYVTMTLVEFVRGAITLSLLPTYGRTVLGFAVEWTALALSVHYLTDNLLRSPVGWMVDRFGQRLPVLLGIAVSAAAVLAMAHARTVPWLVAAAAVYGAGATPMWPAVISGIGAATPQAKRASFMGYLYIFWLLGMGMGLVVINLFAGRNTYGLAFWLLTGVLGVAFAVAWRTVRSERLSAGAASRAGASGEDSPAAAPRRMRLSRRYWRDLWRNVRDVAFLFPGMFAQTFAVAALVPVLSVYFKVVLRMSGAMYSLLLVIGGALTVLLLVPAGKVIDRVGARRVLIPGLLVAGGGLAVYPLLPTRWFTYAVVAVLGAAYAFILPAWNSVLDRSIDPDKKATLWGVFMTVEGFGSAAGPYLGGLLWDAVSPRAPFLLSGAVIMLMGLLYIRLPIEAASRHQTAWHDTARPEAVPLDAAQHDALPNRAAPHEAPRSAAPEQSGAAPPPAAGQAGHVYLTARSAGPDTVGSDPSAPARAAGLRPRRPR
ncbi:MFS transporter [Alicyclobacillus cellulosilyticus]|nr:MFS transporter [Alicyclobacillus cellulosilyticus]